MWHMSRRIVVPAALALLTALAAGCAAGNTATPPVAEGGPSGDGGVAEAGADGYIWPDLGPLPDAYIHPDGVKYDINGQTDGSPSDGPPQPQDAGPDSTPQPDAHVPCPDPLEPNQTCSSGKSLGSVNEGSSWVKKSATLDPGADIDWFTASGNEGSHTCLPLTSQCYYFKVKLSVPQGRKLRVCVYKDSCTASGTCADNAATPGPAVLNVQYKVSGTCAFNDDTDAKILIEPLDGTGGCDPYEVSYNYDEC